MQCNNVCESSQVVNHVKIDPQLYRIKRTLEVCNIHLVV